jgi:hypothetical protein
MWRLCVKQKRFLTQRRQDAIKSDRQIIAYHFQRAFISITVSNCEPPLVIPSGKQAIFHKMDAQFEIRIRIMDSSITAAPSLRLIAFA